MEKELFYLYDIQENCSVRFISFQGETTRYDLGIVQTNNFYGKYIVIDLLGKNYAIIGPDDLEEEGYLEYAYQLTADQALELTAFLKQLI